MLRRFKPFSAWIVAALCLSPGSALCAATARQKAEPATVPQKPVPQTIRIVAATPLGPQFGTGLESEVDLRKGVSSLMAGNPSRAAEALERSIATRPNRPASHVLLGASLLSAGSPRAIGEFPLAVRAFLGDFDSQARFGVNLILLLL